MTRKRDYGEGGIRQRPNGKWEASLRLGNGKRVSKTVATRKDAQAWLQGMRLRREQGEVMIPAKIALADFLDHWLATVESTVKVKTYECYFFVVKNHLKPELGHIPLPRLQPSAIQHLYTQRLKAGLSARTVRLIHQTLRRALAQAVKWGLLSHNAADATEPPRVVRSARPVWSLAEVQRFLAAARNERMFAAYVLAIATGMRQGELLGLHWQDVDMERGAIYVCHALQYTTTKGLTISTPKSAEGFRSIAVPASVIEVLRVHREHQALERQLAAIHGAPWPESDLVFVSQNGTPMLPSNVVRRFRTLKKLAGVSEIRFHDLRHTAATLMLMMNVQPKVVQEMLGHSDISLTLNTYSHVLPNMQRAAANLMNEALAANLPPIGRPSPPPTDRK